VKTDFATFDKTYRFEDNRIVVERTIVVLKNKVAKADWQKYNQFTKDIDLSGENWIRLIEPAKTLAVTKPAPVPDARATQKADNGSVTLHLRSEAAPATAPDTSAAGGTADTVTADASASELMKLAQEKMRDRDWSGARAMLDKVKAKDPNLENLWAMYGYLTMLNGPDFEEAAEDFRKELAAHPDNEYALMALVNNETRNGGPAAARDTLQQFFNRNPGNLRVALELATIQTNANDNEGALKTLEKASQLSPDNRGVRMQMSQALVNLNRMDEAAAVAKSAMDGSDDPEILNGGAYMLSEAGVDLDVAEDASRRSITQMETKSATMTTAEANSGAFAQSSLIVASWDTLGWILFREGKLDDAGPLLSAAWRAGLDAVVGDHLAQVYEAQGNKAKAAATYLLAEAAMDKNTPPSVHTHITESINRLDAHGKPAQGNQAGQRVMRQANQTAALQNLRTFKIPRPAGASGWGTFRLEVTAAGVIESQQMSGEPGIAKAKPAIEAMKLPELIPPGSKVHLLRSAVVSCSMGQTCDVVLVPGGGLQTEQ
jgi:tetratricopeptide (TPR) repeat protein